MMGDVVGMGSNVEEESADNGAGRVAGRERGDDVGVRKVESSASRVVAR